MTKDIKRVEVVDETKLRWWQTVSLLLLIMFAGVGLGWTGYNTLKFIDSKIVTESELRLELEEIKCKTQEGNYYWDEHDCYQVFMQNG